MTEANATRDPYTQDEIDAAVSGDDPRAAIGMFISLLQRMTIALEGINGVMQEEGPVVLFEPADAGTQSDRDTYCGATAV